MQQKPPPFLETHRLRLRSWQDSDRDAFAALNAHPEVMDDLGGPIDRAASDRKLDSYLSAFEKHGYGRWLIEDHAGTFLGYTGVMLRHDDPPLGMHNEIGWRLIRDAWGGGFATEAAQAALDDVFARIGLDEVLAYTRPDNLRSQAVMRRLNLERDEARDFVMPMANVDEWPGWVWVARPLRAS